MQTIPLTDLPGTALLHAWLRHDPTLRAMFDIVEPDASFAERRAAHGASRARLRALAAQGMRGLELTAEQRAALDAVGDPRSTMVVTGQQVGLLGGPLYTILKIASSVAHARTWERAWQRPVVPVFWLEDNDHDAAEAATLHLYSSDGAVTDVVAWDGTDERKPVSTRTFSTAEVEQIGLALATLTGQHADDLRDRLHAVYGFGHAWTDAFLHVLQPFLGPWGVVVIRGSDVIASGMHAPIVQRDLAHPNSVSAHVESASARLLAAGFHAQAQAATHVFFLHDAEGRHRLMPTDDGRLRVGGDILSYDDVRALAASSPERFSPSVLARPIMQDAILPTVATVLGPAELAYHAQLGDAYTWFGVQRPAPVLRHTATLIDGKAERLLAKTGQDVAFYMRAWQDVMQDVVASLDDAGMPAKDQAPVAAASLLAPWSTAAAGIDPTLKGAVEAAQAAVTKTLEQLDGKMRSALKRVHADTLDRHRQLSSTIHPGGSPQERVYSLAHWWARFGVVDLRRLIESITQQPVGTHVVIGASDITTPPGNA